MIKAIAPEPLKEGDRGNAPKASYRAKLSRGDVAQTTPL
jgi:hypothetical protein